MDPFKRTTLIYFVIFWFVYIATVPCYGSKVIHTSAKSLAEKAGAAQYAVHIEEDISSNGRHDLRKRVTDDNLFDENDYEMYQGVVGRPGTDFPVLTSIPQTTFNCRSVGNGYFADLETECQVFHICESGKKISFLCPNGTIFQQTELICDWWFKVNCAAAPGHYAESSEVLSRARGKEAPSNNKNHNTSKAAKNENRTKARDNTLNENFDFDDFSSALNGPKSNALNERRGKTDTTKFGSQEMQELAESQSFAKAAQQSPNFNGYQYRQPVEKDSKSDASIQTSPSQTSTATVASPNSMKSKENNFQGYYYREPERGSRRVSTTKPPSSIESLQYSQEYQETTTTTGAPVTFPHRGTTKYKDSVKQNVDPNPNQFIINVADVPSQDEKQTTTFASVQYTTSTSPPLIRNRGSNIGTKTTRNEPTRTTPYYTPTVPSIATTRPTAYTRFAETRPTVSSAKIAEHAMEMMQTIHDLNLDSQMKEAEVGKETGDRSGLIIPPSSGPETLHSLALYFATAVDSLVTKPIDSTTPTVLPGLKGLDVSVGNVTKLDSTLISDTTKREYQSIFGTDEIYRQIQKTTERSRSVKDSSSSAAQVNEELNILNINNDLETEFSNNPVIAAAGTKQIRELAQVFTHALSAYLHDPSTFRKVLAEIRPTEPPVTQNYEYLNNRLGRQKDFNKGTGATYLPTVATQSAKETLPTTEDFEVLDFSDVTATTLEPKEQTTISAQQNEGETTVFPAIADTFDSSHSQILHDSLKHIDHVPASRILTEGLETHAINQYGGNSLLEGTTEPSNPLAIEINDGLEATTNFPYFDDSENQKLNFTGNPTTVYPDYGTTVPPSSLNFDLLPPSDVNKGINEGFPQPIDENDLQRAQSQSIFGNGKNKLDQRIGKEFGEKTEPKSLKIENGHYITEITPTSTPSSDSQSKTTVADSGKFNPNSWSTLSYSAFLDPLTINDGLMDSNEQSTVTPSQNTYLPHSTQSPIYNAITEPTPSRTTIDKNRQGKAQTFTSGTESAPPSHEDYMEVMQRKANEMFGNLNDTQADHLMNVMKKADKNKTVRRLILLLIQTCDNDDYNTTIEQSRQALLNALIRMDDKIENENEIQIIKTHRGEKGLNLNRQQLNTASTTTQLPITTYHRPLSVRFDYTQSTHTPQPSYYTETTTNNNYPTYQSTDYYADTTITPNYEYSTVGPTTYPTEITKGDSTTTTYYQSPSTTTYEPIQTTTNIPVITTTTTATTTTARPSSRRKQTTQPPRNSKRLAKDLDQYLANQGDTNFNVNQAHRNSDARALELLRSLYSLAGRFVANNLPNFSRGRSGSKHT